MSIAAGVEALTIALVQPFLEFGFMRRALVACIALGLSGAPLGVLLVLRRMSLMGDALAHALLPGAAAGFLVAGLSMPAMGLGGFIAALLVAVLSGGVARFTTQREDASFAAFYLMALAAGVMMISLRGSSVDLVRVLFGGILAVDSAALLLVVVVVSLSLLLLAVYYRPLVVECFDPAFLRLVGGGGSWHHQLFLLLVVANLVAGFQTLGTLMSVGMMMLPAIAARCWASSIGRICAIAALIAAVSGWAGLLLSFHTNLPTGPSIVLLAGLAYLVSITVGTRDSLRVRWFSSHTHKVA